MEKQKKFYYVQNCDYGINVSPSSLGGDAYSYYAFTSYQEREKWLEEHEWYNCSLVYACITRKQLQRRIGKRFVIVNDYGLDDNDDKQVAYGVIGVDAPDVAYPAAVYYSF